MSGYIAIFEQAPDGGWGVYVPDLPGCTSWGETRTQAAQNVRNAISTYLRAHEDMHEPLPPPHAFTEFISV